MEHATVLMHHLLHRNPHLQRTYSSYAWTTLWTPGLDRLEPGDAEGEVGLLVALPLGWTLRRWKRVLQTEAPTCETPPSEGDRRWTARPSALGNGMGLGHRSSRWSSGSRWMYGGGQSGLATEKWPQKWRQVWLIWLTSQPPCWHEVSRMNLRIYWHAHTFRMRGFWCVYVLQRMSTHK